MLHLTPTPQLLRRSLTGYEEYCQKVKYRLLPFIW